jgi:hypothetical protein
MQGRNQKTDEEHKERNMEGVREHHHGKDIIKDCLGQGVADIWQA